HFLARHAAEYGRPRPELSPEHLAALRAHPWPGNIRQLENTCKRIVLLGPEAALLELGREAKAPPPSAAAPPADEAPPCPADVRPLKEVVRQATREAILAALRATQGSRTQAAQLLGVSRKTLFNKMQDLGIREESSWS
ncbi:MAG: two-component system response regulator, partial [Planctomycetota bacterium]